MNSLMMHLANSLVQQFEKKKIVLDYSLQSVSLIEDELAAIHKTRSRVVNVFMRTLRNTIRRQNLKEVSLPYGAYVGECIRRTCGGDWISGGEMYNGMNIPTLRLPNGSELWPQFKVEKRIINGDSDNVYDFARLIALRSCGAPASTLGLEDVTTTFTQTR